MEKSVDEADKNTGGRSSRIARFFHRILDASPEIARFPLTKRSMARPSKIGAWRRKSVFSRLERRTSCSHRQVSIIGQLRQHDHLVRRACTLVGTVRCCFSRPVQPSAYVSNVGSDMTIPVHASDIDWSSLRNQHVKHFQRRAVLSGTNLFCIMCWAGASSKR
jgi:hypothetical protein